MNSHLYLKSIALLFVAGILHQQSAMAQFSGSYDPSNWTTVQISGANGSMNTTNAPTSIVLTGPDNISNQAYTRYQIVVPTNGTISFDWSVVHNDPGYDGFGYWYNNIYTELTDATASGSTSVNVTGGQLFAFYAETFDGCCGTFNATISNFSGPLPSVNDAGIYAINNPSGSLCADTIPVSVTVKNHGANQISPVTVGWSVNGVSQPSVQYSGTLDTAGGSGSDTATIALGNYYFIDTVDLVVWTTMPNNVNDTSNQNDTANLNFISSNPEINLEDQDMCEGDFFILEAPAGFSTYLWSNGSTASQIMITQGGGYGITVTDAFGCEASDSVVVTEYPSPVVDMGEDLIGCDELELDAGNPGSTYTWSTSDSTQSIDVTSSGWYSVTVENAQGCVGSGEVEVTIYPSPVINLGTDFSLCVDIDETAVLIVSSQYQFYQWSNGATTNQIIVGGLGTPTGNTPFSLVVTDQNGCTGTDTIKVNFKNCIPQGIESESTQDGILVYPNPASGWINIEIRGTESESVALSLYDSKGQLLQSLQPGAIKTNEVYRLNAGDLSGGIYFLHGTSSNGKGFSKTIVIE